MTPLLTNTERVLIYASGILDELAEAGFISPAPLRPTTYGRAIYDSLLASGFSPSDEELAEAMHAVLTYDDQL